MLKWHWSKEKSVELEKMTKIPDSSAKIGVDEDENDPHERLIVPEFL